MKSSNIDYLELIRVHIHKNALKSLICCSLLSPSKKPTRIYSTGRYITIHNETNEPTFLIQGND